MNNEPLDAYSLADLIKSTLDASYKENAATEVQPTCDVSDGSNGATENHKDTTDKHEKRKDI